MIAVYGLGGLSLLCYGFGNSMFDIQMRVVRSSAKVEFRDKPIGISIVDGEAEFTDTTPTVRTQETSPKVTVR